MKLRNTMYKFGRRIGLVQNSVIKTLCFTLASMLTIITVYVISLTIAQFMVSAILLLMTAALFYIATKPTSSPITN